MKTIQFEVLGEPKGQPRARSVAYKGKDGRYHAQVYTAGTAEEWKARIATEAKRHLPERPHEGPVSLGVEFRLPRPMSHFGTGRNRGKLKPSAPKKNVKGPDLDNMIKAVKDILTYIGMWRDDKLVYRYVNDPIRRYVRHEIGERSGATISVYLEDE